MAITVSPPLSEGTSPPPYFIEKTNTPFPSNSIFNPQASSISSSSSTLSTSLDSRDSSMFSSSLSSSLLSNSILDDLSFIEKSPSKAEIFFQTFRVKHSDAFDQDEIDFILDKIIPKHDYQGSLYNLLGLHFCHLFQKLNWISPKDFYPLFESWHYIYLNAHVGIQKYHSFSNEESSPVDTTEGGMFMHPKRCCKLIDDWFDKKLIEQIVSCKKILTLPETERQTLLREWYLTRCIFKKVILIQDSSEFFSSEPPPSMRPLKKYTETLALFDIQHILKMIIQYRSWPDQNMHQLFNRSEIEHNFNEKLFHFYFSEHELFNHSTITQLKIILPILKNLDLLINESLYLERFYETGIRCAPKDPKEREEYLYQLMCLRYLQSHLKTLNLNLTFFKNIIATEANDASLNYLERIIASIETLNLTKTAFDFQMGNHEFGQAKLEILNFFTGARLERLYSFKKSYNQLFLHQLKSFYYSPEHLHKELEPVHDFVEQKVEKVALIIARNPPNDETRKEHVFWLSAVVTLNSDLATLLNRPPIHLDRIKEILQSNKPVEKKTDMSSSAQKTHSAVQFCPVFIEDYDGTKPLTHSAPSLTERLPKARPLTNSNPIVIQNYTGTNPRPRFDPTIIESYMPKKA